MSLTIHPDAIPLRVDEHGVCRVAGTRVMLELIVNAFDRGATPEEIANSYPSVPLGDVYATIAYGLKHRPEVGAYLRESAEEAVEIRRRTGRLPRRCENAPLG